MKYLFLITALLITASAFSSDIIKIEIGKKGGSYSKKELERRIYRLEQAVWQLQQRVFNLETTSTTTTTPNPGIEWLCKISAMGEFYTGIGGSKAVATHRAVENCKAARSGDGFFCKDVKCEK